MTSLLRRVVATFVEPVDRAASSKPSLAPRHRRRSGDRAARTGRRRGRRSSSRRHAHARGDPQPAARVGRPHHHAAERSRRHPGGVDAPHASRPGGTRVARCDRPADATRPSGDHRRDRARGRRRGGPGRGCLRRRVARPRTRRRRTPLRLAADRRADGRPRAALGRRRRRSPAVDPRGRDDACGAPARRSPRSPRTGGDGARSARLAPARAGAVGRRRPGPPLPRDRGSARRDRRRRAARRGVRAVDRGGGARARRAPGRRGSGAAGARQRGPAVPRGARSSRRSAPARRAGRRWPDSAACDRSARRTRERPASAARPRGSRAGRRPARRRSARGRRRRGRARRVRSRTGRARRGPARGRPRALWRARGRCTTPTSGSSSRHGSTDAPNPRHLDKDAYLALGRDAATRVARANGAPAGRRRVPGRADDRAGADQRRGAAADRDRQHRHHDARERRGRAGAARAARAGPPSPPAAATTGRSRTARASRCARTSRRRSTAWRGPRRADGVALVIASAFRSDAEQAVLFARHPDPKWVAPPGHVAAPQRHRARPRPGVGLPLARRERAALPLRPALQLGTLALRLRAEPALGAARRPRRAPPRAAADGDAPRAGCPTSCRSASRRRSTAPRSAGASRRRCSPPSCTPRAASTRSRRARRARRASRSSCRAPRAAMGLDDPFDPGQAIDAQAHLMRDLLRQFGAVPLALAAYNAGPAPVSACGCVPAVPRDARLRRADPRTDERRGRGLDRRARRQAWSCAWSGDRQHATRQHVSRSGDGESRYRICSSRSTWKRHAPDLSDPAGRVA